MHTTGCLGVSPETCSFFVFSPPDQTMFFFLQQPDCIICPRSMLCYTFHLHHIDLLVPELFVYSPDKPSGGVSTVFFCIGSFQEGSKPCDCCDSLGDV